MSDIPPIGGATGGEQHPVHPRGMQRSERREHGLPDPSSPAPAEDLSPVDELTLTVPGRVASILLDDPVLQQYLAERGIPSPLTAWEEFLRRMSDPAILSQLAILNPLLHAIVGEEMRRR